MIIGVLLLVKSYKQGQLSQTSVNNLFYDGIFIKQYISNNIDSNVRQQKLPEEGMIAVSLEKLIFKPSYHKLVCYLRDSYIF